MRIRLFHLSIALLALAALAVLGVRIYFIYCASPNLGAMETSVVYALQRILAGLPLYSDPEAAPFAIIQYSPLYYEVVGTAGSWLGVNPDQPMAVFVLNRWAGLLFNLLGLLLIGNIIKGITLENKWKAVIILLAWTCLEPALYARPDALQSLCFLLFVAAGLKYIQKNGWQPLLVMIVAASLAVWSKQNGILLLFFLLFYLFIIAKHFKHGLIAALSLVALNSLFWLLMVEDAGIFWANVIRGLDNGISFPYFFDTIYDAGVKKFFPFFLAGIYLGFMGVFSPKGKEDRFLGWLLVVTFIFASLTALKWGSVPSYYTDFIHLSLIAGTFWLTELKLSDRLKNSFSANLFAGLLILLIIPLHTSGKEWGRVFRESRSDWFEQAKQLKEAVYKMGLPQDSYIFTHDYLINLHLFRHCLFPQNDIVYCCTAPRKTYDYSRFAELIKSGKVAFVIDWKAEHPRAFLGEDFATFSPVKSIGPYTIWKIEVGQHSEVFPNFRY